MTEPSISAQPSLSTDFAVFEATREMRIVFLPDTPNFTIVAATQDFCKHVKLSKVQLVGQYLFKVFPSNPSDPYDTGERDLRASLHHVLTYKEPHQLPIQRYDVKEEDGSFKKKYWRVENIPVLDVEGWVIYIIHTTEDITDQLGANEVKERLKVMEPAHNLFLQAPVAIQIYKGADLVLELANETALTILGKGADIIGKPLLEVLPEIREAGYTNLLLQVMETGTPNYVYDAPVSFVVDGKERLGYYNSVYQPYYDENNTKATGVIVFGFDVTARMLAEQKAAESEDRFRVLADQTPMIVFMADTDVSVTFANKYWLEYAGQGRNVLGYDWKETVHPDDLQPFLESYTSAASAEENYSIETRIKASDGEYRYFIFTGGPRYTVDGTLLGYIGTGIDVHDRKRAEDALKKSENNFRNMVLRAPVAMCVFRGKDYVVEIANDSMLDMWGKKRVEVIGKPIFEANPEGRGQGFEEILETVYRTKEPFQVKEIPLTLLRKGQLEAFYTNVSYDPIIELDGTVSGILVVGIDVTDQVLARMKIEESNKEFQFVTDFLPQMIWVTRADGYHYYYNKQWYDYTGLTYGETEGEGWNHVFHPDDREHAWKQWRHSLATGEPYEIEYRCRRFDGHYRWVLGRALPLRDVSGRILKWFGTCTDIHDQKREAQILEEKVKERTGELESQKKELERSNAHLQDFAYAASHDLKEPIRKIRTFLDRLKNRLRDRLMDEDQHYFERMQNATERMQLLIDDLLEFSYISMGNHNLERIDLNKKVLLVLDDLELEIAEKNAKIVVGELPIIMGHRRQIQQVFQNLITNALKFKKPNTNPEVRITSTVISGKDPNLSFSNEDTKNKIYNLIEVSDNGIGFEQDYADKIFKMFQRLHAKTEYEGTGIGLAIVRKVVENHNGFIRAESKPGKGAKFKIYIPVV